MKLCIVGSRNFKNLELVRRFVRRLKPETIIVSGAARGVDQAAEEEALLTGHDVESWPVTAEDWKRDGKAAGILRNREMILGYLDPEVGDGLVAFWDGQSRGTRNAIKLARQAGLFIRVYREDGTWKQWPNRSSEA
jgi:hypothetical protein